MIEIVKFQTPNCLPCKFVQTLLDKTAEQLKGEPVLFSIVDVSVEIDKTSNFNVTKAPTVIVFKDNQEVHRYVGALFKQSDLLALIKSLL